MHACLSVCVCVCVCAVQSCGAGASLPDSRDLAALAVGHASPRQEEVATALCPSCHPHPFPSIFLTFPQHAPQNDPEPFKQSLHLPVTVNMNNPHPAPHADSSPFHCGSSPGGGGVCHSVICIAATRLLLGVIAWLQARADLLLRAAFTRSSSRPTP